MTDGIKKETLERRRVNLDRDIHDLLTKEKEISGQVHELTAEKAKLKQQIIAARNDLVTLDALIEECGPIEAEVIGVGRL